MPTKPKIEELIQAAIESKNNSHSPHSKFKVGAALLTSTGKIFKGTNVEFDAYSLTVCAERSALFSAISNGSKKFRMIAISTDRKGFKFPCGLCRQALAEFNPNMDIILINNENHTKRFNLKPLLPNFFKL